MSDPDRISEIVNKITDNVTTSSGSPPPPNTAPNATDVSAFENGSFGFAVHLQPRQEIINEVNPENASGTTTPCNFPSTSREQKGNRSTVFIDRRMANCKYSTMFNDPAIQLLTRVLFCPGEPDNDDVMKLKNSLLTREQIEQFKKARAAQNSTKNPSPADKQN